jgi:hypothetical protein
MRSIAPAAGGIHTRDSNGTCNLCATIYWLSGVGSKEAAIRRIASRSSCILMGSNPAAHRCGLCSREGPRRTRGLPATCHQTWERPTSGAGPRLGLGRVQGAWQGPGQLATGPPDPYGTSPGGIERDATIWQRNGGRWPGRAVARPDGSQKRTELPWCTFIVFPFLFLLTIEPLPTARAGNHRF